MVFSSRCSSSHTSTTRSRLSLSLSQPNAHPAPRSVLAAAATIPQPIRSSNLLLPQPTCLSHSSHSFAPSLSRDCTRHDQISALRPAVRLARKSSKGFTYLVAAVMSSLGIASMAVMAVYYRFAWQMEEGGRVPLSEMFGTFALSVGAAVGMEFWARWAHRALWHASLGHMPESHHRPKDGELNDVLAINNAVPAIALLSYGFFHKGLVPGLRFGAGLGMALACMFVHDGLVHRRFPVGPIANVPYFRRVAAAHRATIWKISAAPIKSFHLHHSDKFNGVAIVHPPVRSGGLANGGGEGGAMAIGKGKCRRVKSLVLLALLGGRNVVASASSTLVFTNACSIPIFPSLIPTDGSPKINNSTSLSAIGPNHELSVPLSDGWSGIAIFSTGCVLDGLGTRNCTTGNCEGRECTAEDSPVATGLGISSDSYTMSVDMGYNVGLTVSPMCAGCDCPSASCKAQLESCPHDLRVYNKGTVVACKPGSGLHFSENHCTVPGDYSTSKASLACPFKNVAVKIEIAC